MAWLGQVSADSSYLLDVALPMILIGIGQGGSLGPLTISGVFGVATEDAGAASGLVNAAHQLGGSLGLAVLVVVFAAAGAGTPDDVELLAHSIAVSLTVGAAMLALSLVVAYGFIVRPAQLRRAHALQTDDR
jgi:hypothetical protein